jgi:hypothetical protein
LSLRFEILNIKIEKSEELEDHALFSGQFKGKCRHCGRIGHKSFQCNGGNNGNLIGGNYCSYCRKPGHVKHNCFKFKNKETRYGHNQVFNNNNGNRERENDDLQDVQFAATSKNEKLKEDIWTCDNGAGGHHCDSSKELFNEEIRDIITAGNGKSMMAIKFGSMK